MITWLDTEGVGLIGPSVLLQWADGDERVHLLDIWLKPARDTLQVIEHVVESDAEGGWNLTFDHFKLQQLYTVLRLLPPGKPPTVNGWVKVEKRAALFGPCVKPRSALDLFLFARRGPWQSLMNRDDIKIRRVPRALADMLAHHLTQRIELDPIYFSRRKEGYKWERVDNDDDPDFPDVVLRFGASGGLKPLARHLLGVDAVDFPAPDELFPESENLWDPFDHCWIPFLKGQVDYWAKNKKARKYATDDVLLTRRLWEHFGKPAHGDTDSVLACQVASSRWRGFAVSRAATSRLLAKSEKDRESAPRAPGAVKEGLHKRMSGVERLAVDNTRNATLEEIGGVLNKGVWSGGWADNTNARNFARRVMRARSAEKRVDTCKKLLHVGRGHPDFRIIATLSNRMGGTGGMNWQAFSDDIKACLLLADGNLSRLAGGDFWAFEVTLAAAVYKDPRLIADLASGKKMHALFGAEMYEMDYDDLYDDEEEKALDKERYDLAKRGFFGKLYGAQDPKLAQTLGLTLDQVAAGSKRFEERYPGVGEARQRISNAFCSMRQPAGVGTKVVWHEPADFVDSLFGARRYFTLENEIARHCFELGNAMPGEFRRLKFKVSRRAGRIQTPGGATQSAIFACAFNIQSRAMRAAANHEIQASGATITKRLQAALWERQPAGIHDWVLSLLNEHDSLMVPQASVSPVGDWVRDKVGEVVESFRPTVPLIRMDWKMDLPSWGDK